MLEPDQDPKPGAVWFNPLKLQCISPQSRAVNLQEPSLLVLDLKRGVAQRCYTFQPTAGEP